MFLSLQQELMSLTLRAIDRVSWDYPWKDLVLKVFHSDTFINLWSATPKSWNWFWLLLSVKGRQLCDVQQTKTAVDFWSGWFLRETLWQAALQTWWSKRVFYFSPGKVGRMGSCFFSYPHRPFTETQRRQSLDWAPDGEFIKCNKWRQNASSCPWWLRMDLTYTGGGDIWQGLQLVMQLLSSPSCRDFSCSVIYHLRHKSAYRQTWSRQIFNCILRGNRRTNATGKDFHYLLERLFSGLSKNVSNLWIS